MFEINYNNLHQSKDYIHIDLIIQKSIKYNLTL